MTDKPENPPAFPLPEWLIDILCDGIMAETDEEIMEGVTEEEIAHNNEVFEKAISKADAMLKAREEK